MKKLLSCFSLALCVLIGTVCLSACGSKTKWVRPEFSIKSEDYRIEHITNMESDFEFPIEDVKLDHSKFSDEHILEYAWVIYDGANNLVGWIETGNGYESDKKGNYSYGFFADRNTGEYAFATSNICLILKSTDLTVFDNIEVSSNYGVVSDPHKFKAAEIYLSDGAEPKPLKGTENFVCCYYSLVLDGIDPDTVESIKIEFTPKSSK